MFRLIVPVILIGGAIAGFLMIVSPTYQDVQQLKMQANSYNQALDNSKTLENERDKLMNKYKTIDDSNLKKLQKLLPDNVDNIRLILEIEKIAQPYGMVLKDVKYNAAPTEQSTSGKAVQGGNASKTENKNYGDWDLEFSVQGPYANFLNFTSDLENNLRIVDIVSIQFSSDVASGNRNVSSENYKYSFKIKTYWLKN